MGQEFSQSMFVGAAVMAVIAILLHVNNGWMMEIEEDKPDCGGKIGKLPLDPKDLLTAGQQGRIAVEVKHIYGTSQLYGIPSPSAELREGVPHIFKALLLG